MTANKPPLPVFFCHCFGSYTRPERKSSSSPTFASAFRWIPSFSQPPGCSLFHLFPPQQRTDDTRCRRW